ncbi:MAG: VWA domain-containing protein [Bacteroidota bacterium]
MRFICYLFIVCFLFIQVPARAQIASEGKQARILILLDGSSSMIESWYKDQSRFTAAGSIITGLIDSVYKVNDQVEFSLRVFGHQYPAKEKNCFDTKREVMFSKNNLTQMAFRVSSISPSGVSPIAYSLKQAAENDFTNADDYAYSLVLITDGGESCGGDICSVVRTLLDKKIYFKPYIVSMVDYAPLKGEYDCLGTYLQVTKPEDIPKAIGAIVASYKKMMLLPTYVIKPFIIEPIVPYKFANVGLANVPQPEMEKDTILYTTIAALRELTIGIPEPQKVNTIKVDKILVIKEPDVMVGITSLPMLPIKLIDFKITFNPIVPNKVPAPKYDEDLNPIGIGQNKEVVNTINPTSASTINVGSIPKAKQPEILNPIVANRHVKQLTTRIYIEPFKIISPVVAVMDVPIAATPVATKPTPVVAPVKPKPDTIAKKPTTIKPTPKTETPLTALATNNIKEIPYTIDAKIAAETSVEIYFTDGKGKFFSTTPQIVLTDPATGKEVQKFYRTVDASGNPDPKKNIAPGTYNLTVTGKKNFVMKNVAIKANTDQKIMVPVSRGTLSFRYTGKPDRPVEEFFAVVKRIIDVGPTIKQKCTAVLTYEPGEYHIEINTLPVTKRAVPLDFGDETIIDIDEPGYVYFTNMNQVGKVSLYCPLGDQYVRFHTMDVVGNLQDQKIKLQPGIYQARFIRNEGKPNASQASVGFIVKSNEATELELK